MPVRLNIGCGTAPTEGWLNYDNSPALRLGRFPPLLRVAGALGLVDGGSLGFAAFARARGIRYADAVLRIPHPDGSVDAIYSSHMIEHLDRSEARRFLGECQRVLRPGGRLRLVVPDLRVTVDDYVAKGNADIFLDQLQLALDKPHGMRGHLRNILVGSRNHHWLYDGRSLQRLVRDNGFEQVEVMEPGSTRLPDPGKLNLSERIGESVYVEGRKPGAE